MTRDLLHSIPPLPLSSGNVGSRKSSWSSGSSTSFKVKQSQQGGASKDYVCSVSVFGTVSMILNLHTTCRRFGRKPFSKSWICHEMTLDDASQLQLQAPPPSLPPAAGWAPVGGLEGRQKRCDHDDACSGWLSLHVYLRCFLRSFLPVFSFLTWCFFLLFLIPASLAFLSWFLPSFLSSPLCFSCLSSFFPSCLPSRCVLFVVSFLAFLFSFSSTGRLFVVKKLWICFLIRNTREKVI